MRARSERRQLNDTFDALANEHRRSMVYRLSLRPASITELAGMEGLSLPAIHKHIRVLERARLLLRKKSGRTNFLAIDRTGLRGVREWIEQYHSYWGTNEETLENYVAVIERKNESITSRRRGKQVP